MQKELLQVINNINKEFQEVVGGSYVHLKTGEIFTETEVKKYTSKKIESFVSNNIQEIRKTADSIGVDFDQVIVNKRSSRKKKSKTKARFDNGEFNIVYKNEIVLRSLMNMNLKNNEKLVYYILRDFVSYPSNAVLINNEIPTMEQLEPIIGMKERAIRRAIKGLEDSNLIKGKRIGARKMLVFNPFYYASGKDLDIDSLKIFDLLDYDESKVEEYLNQDY